MYTGRQTWFRLSSFRYPYFFILCFCSVWYPNTERQSSRTHPNFTYFEERRWTKPSFFFWSHHLAQLWLDVRGRAGIFVTEEGGWTTGVKSWFSLQGTLGHWKLLSNGLLDNRKSRDVFQGLEPLETVHLLGGWFCPEKHGGWEILPRQNFYSKDKEFHPGNEGKQPLQAAPVAPVSVALYS